MTTPPENSWPEPSILKKLKNIDPNAPDEILDIADSLQKLANAQEIKTTSFNFKKLAQWTSVGLTTFFAKPVKNIMQTSSIDEDFCSDCENVARHFQSAIKVWALSKGINLAELLNAEELASISLAPVEKHSSEQVSAPM